MCSSWFRELRDNRFICAEIKTVPSPVHVFGCERRCINEVSFVSVLQLSMFAMPDYWSSRTGCVAQVVLVFRWY